MDVIINAPSVGVSMASQSMDADTGTPVVRTSVLDYELLQNKPKINDVELEGELTGEQLGLYEKPSGGIPSSDMTEEVQTSLGKADTAIQEHQSLAAYRTSADQDLIDAGFYSLPDGGIPAADLANTYAGSAAAGGIANGTQAIPYGEVDSTSTATVFTATIPGITELKHGTIILLKNGVITSASGFTVNVNGLGAKPVYSSMSAASAETTLFNVNYTLLLVYDEVRVTGGCWLNYRGYNSDTNTIGYQIRSNNTVLKTTDKNRYYKIFFTSQDGTHWVPATADSANSATSAKTVNQKKIDPFGRIVYTSATTSYAAEADIAAGTIWDRYNLTLGYSFNRTGSALTLTSKTPVYVKCAPQTDGSAIMDSTTPIVQALPSTNDGKIYIFLGIATSATQVELALNHPVYYHNGTGIRLWTGGA